MRRSRMARLRVSITWYESRAPRSNRSHDEVGSGKGCEIEAKELLGRVETSQDLLALPNKT